MLCDQAAVPLTSVHVFHGAGRDGEIPLLPACRRRNKSLKPKFARLASGWGEQPPCHQDHLSLSTEHPSTAVPSVTGTHVRLRRNHIPLHTCSHLTWSPRVPRPGDVGETEAQESKAIKHDLGGEGRVLNGVDTEPGAGGAEELKATV